MFFVWAYLFVCYWDMEHVTVVIERVIRHWVPFKIATERIVNPQIIAQPNQLPSTYG